MTSATDKSNLRVVIYSRVSTAEGHRKSNGDPSQDPETQTQPLRDYADRRGWDVVEEVTDRESGTKASRPGWDRVLQLARSRELDGILVAALDRIGRSLVNVVNDLAELDALGVALVSRRENLDGSTPAGRAMIGMCVIFAQLESELTGARVRDGMARAKRQGKSIGRSKVQVDLDRVGTLLDEGKSQRQVATILGIGRATLAKALKERGGRKGSPEPDL